MRGRKPKPTALKKAEGNPGKRKLNEREPKPAAGVGSPPVWLDDFAKTVWRRVVKELEAVGMLTRVDRDSLGCYCQAVSSLKTAREEIAKDGITIQGLHGPVKNPACAVEKDAMTAIRQFGSEFGLTPASRARLTTPENKTETDEFENDFGKPNLKLRHG